MFMFGYFGVLKFSYERSNLATIRSSLTSDWNVNRDFYMSLIDPRHVYGLKKNLN